MIIYNKDTKVDIPKETIAPIDYFSEWDKRISNIDCMIIALKQFEVKNYTIPIHSIRVKRYELKFVTFEITYYGDLFCKTSILVKTNRDFK